MENYLCTVRWHLVGRQDLIWKDLSWNASIKDKMIFHGRSLITSWIKASEILLKFTGLRNKCWDATVRSAIDGYATTKGMRHVNSASFGMESISEHLLSDCIHGFIMSGKIENSAPVPAWRNVYVRTLLSCWCYFIYWIAKLPSPERINTSPYQPMQYSVFIKVIIGVRYAYCSVSSSHINRPWYYNNFAYG